MTGSSFYVKINLFVCNSFLCKSVSLFGEVEKERQRKHTCSLICNDSFIHHHYFSVLGGRFRDFRTKHFFIFHKQIPQDTPRKLIFAFHFKKQGLLFITHTHTHTFKKEKKKLYTAPKILYCPFCVVVVVVVVVVVMLSAFSSLPAAAGCCV